MFTYLIPSRRRAEDARVASFLDAIELSTGRHAAAPWPAVQPDDTVHVPRFVLLAAVPLVALAAACSSPAPAAPAEPVATIAPALETDRSTWTGTDAGLIPAPAPTVAELDQLEDAAPDAIPAEIPAVTEPPAAPAPPAVAAPAPVVDPAAQEDVPQEVLEQTWNEALGSHRCPVPEDVVLAVTDAGDYVCGPQQ